MTRPEDAPVPRDQLVVHELAGETVVFVPDSGDLHHLNAAATLVWKLLGPGVPLRLIATEIAVATETDPDRVQADVLALVERLGVIGLLRQTADATADERTPA
jgi:hypothetical protein